MVSDNDRPQSHPPTLDDVIDQIDQLWEDYPPDERAVAAARLCMVAPELTPFVRILIADDPDVGDDAKTAALGRCDFVAARAESITDLERLNAWQRYRNPVFLLPAELDDTPNPTREDESAEEIYTNVFGAAPTVTPYPTGGGISAVSEAPDYFFLIDPELARLAIGLNCASLFRLWTMARQLSRQENGCGWVTKTALQELLSRQHITYSTRHIRRLLASGEGIFWNVHEDRIYLRSWSHVGKTLTRQALDAGNLEVESNLPGARQLYVPVMGSLEQWEALLYAAWMVHREDPIVSREQLEWLFGRDQTTLRRWETKRLKKIITKRFNYAQSPSRETLADYVPDHATRYVARSAEGLVLRIRWQVSNSYTVSGLRQHAHKGQASKVRNACREVADMPADEGRGGWHRLYFETAEGMKRYSRKHNYRTGETYAYVWRGENRTGQGIFELNLDGFPMTRANDNVSKREARRYYASQCAKGAAMQP